MIAGTIRKLVHREFMVVEHTVPFHEGEHAPGNCFRRHTIASPFASLLACTLRKHQQDV